MNEHDIETLAALYAIGALDGEERAQFEARLAAGDPACLEALRVHEETLARLAMEDPRVIPPAYVKEQLLERIAASEGTRRGARTRVSPGWWRWAAVAAAAGIAGAWLGGGYTAARYEVQLGQMARERAALHAQLRRAETTLAEQVAVYREAVDLLRDPATRVVDLHGQGPASTAVGRVIFHEKSGGHVFVANLPPAPAGKTYELWTIAGAAPRPAGTFDVDPAGRAAHPVPAADDGPVKVFAVTVEPAGGVPAPTGPMVLASAK